MTTTSDPHVDPPIVAALNENPLLWQQAGDGLRRQLNRVAERTTHSVGRSGALEAVELALGSTPGGLITVEGPPGSGVTTLLCQVIARRPCAFWLGDEDGGDGVRPLCAQIIALRRLAVPLVPPAAHSDARVLERLLDEAAHAPSDEPLLLVYDAPAAGQPRTGMPQPFPARLPPGVVLLYGCAPAADQRWPAGFAQPTQRIVLSSFTDAPARVFSALNQSQPERLHEAIVRHSRGNELYVRLAPDLLRSGALVARELPVGLDALHVAWWRSLDALGRRLALLLAAVIDPLPVALCGELLSANPEPLLTAWGALVEHSLPPAAEHGDAEATVALYHPATRAFVAARAPDQLASTHTSIAFHTLDALQQSAAPGGVAHMSSGGTLGYVLSQFARHAALGTPASLADALPLVAGRTWVRFQKRRGTIQAAASDASWELWWAAQSESPLRLVRAAFLTGTLTTLARALPPDAPADILEAALTAPNRDAVLKKLIALCDQLPDGRDKAQTMRRLGEVCYGARLRTAAMRLLSQALDMEEQTPSRTLVDERESLQAALARAAIAHAHTATALAICDRIANNERHGLVRTEVVRALLAEEDWAGAQVVAQAIGHDSMRAWAVAEVAVAHARAGNIAFADELLAALDLDTALAWAQIELACEQGRTNDALALARIERLEPASQRDRGRARLAHTLAQADKDGDALHVASQIVDVAVRVSALLDLRLMLEGLVAMLALEEATAIINAVQGNDRVPLTAALATAHAVLGRRDRAVVIAQQLAEGEERDRALARVAVALGGGGNFADAQQIAASLADDDERDWAYEELTRLLARAARWEEAHATGQRINAPEPRAHTLADVYIEQARHGEPVAAHTLAAALERPGERARALTEIAPLLVAAGQASYAIAASAVLDTPDARSRYEAALVAALVEQLAARPDQASAIWSSAHALAHAIVRPDERARALLALATSALPDQVLARRTLGEALYIAATSRSAALRCLEQAAPLLVSIGGSTLLGEVSASIEEIDAW